MAVHATATADRVRPRVEAAIAGQEGLSKPTLGVFCRQLQGSPSLGVDALVVQPQLQLATVLIPVIEDRLAGVSRHQAQEVLLGAVTDQVEIQARLRLMRQVAEYIEVDHQLVIGPFQQRIVHPPEGLRDLTDQALAHRGTVVLAENGQQRIVVAGP
ncbi:hypothetical protein D9M68_859580 [compost metagenome]